MTEKVSLEIEWATICERVILLTERPMIMWPLIQGTYADLEDTVTFTVAVAIGGDSEHLGVGRLSIRYEILDPEMNLIWEKVEPGTVIYDPDAVPGKKAMMLHAANVTLPVSSFGVYTVNVSLDGGRSWTLTYAVAAWPEP
ncbi:MAG: hypothetical protein WD064_04380 [Acidimicrobiia bacterium]